MYNTGRNLSLKEGAHMKWYIPREHGAWAMVIVPYWVGAFISGVHWSHLLFFLGILSLYFAQAPLLTFVRNSKNTDVWPSFFVYVIIGLTFILPYLFSNGALLKIGLCIIPLFFINIYFAKTKRERLFINDFVAIVALSCLMLLAYRLTQPSLSAEIFLYLFIVIIFFTSTVFHVKSHIREKKNKRFHQYSLIYHLAIVVIAFIFQWFGAAAAFIINFVKTLLPKNMFNSPKRIGIIEIVNSTLFFLLVVGAHYLL